MSTNALIQHYKNASDKLYIFSYTTRETLEFPAFITSFSDDRTSLWNSAQIYGKMDPVYTYKNTTRKISISFDVPCESESDARIYDTKLRVNMRKGMYPIYQERYMEEKRFTLNSPPLHRIRYANLIKSKRPYTQKIGDASLISDGLLGWIDGYTFSPKIDNGFFVNQSTIAAKIFSVNLTLNVIHEHFVGYDVEGNSRTIQITDLNKAQIVDDAQQGTTASTSNIDPVEEFIV